jgi:Fe-S cluster biogenesis protein NfuA/nitrite reductase/ring-hydroxylating ferredoxin subunit
MHQPPPHPASLEDDVAPPDLRRTGERIDALIDALAGGGTGPATPARSRERAEDLVRAVTDLYGAGLERLLDIVHDSGRLDEELLDLLAGDELVASLLLVHGLHPYDVRTRVEHALDEVRPYLGSHGGDVELLAVTDTGAVHLRLLGSCDGCPSSSVTLELAVQDAVEAAAPEISSIEVESPTSTAAGGTLIPVEALRTRIQIGTPEAGAGADWHALPAVVGLASGQALTATAGDTELFVCRVGPDLFAFRDGCGRCSGSLAGALPVRRLGAAAGEAVLTCPACGAHYDVRRAGACLDAADLHLTPFPLLAEAGTVVVALPATVGA